MLLTVGLVGCGRWGRRHLEVLKELKASGDLARIVVCDLDASRLLDLGVDAVYTSTVTMLSEERLDAMAIVTPPSSHVETLILASAQGLPTLVEKPLSDDIDEVLEGLKLMDEQATVMVGYLLRHHLGVRRLRAMTDGGELGELRSFSYTRTTRRPRPEGADPLNTLAVHGLDLLTWMADTPLGAMKVQRNEVSVNKANLQLLTPDEQLGEVLVSWSSDQERRLINLNGTLGSARLDFGTGVLTIRHGNHRVDHLTGTPTPLQEEWNEFLKWVRSKKPHVYPDVNTLLDQSTWLHRFSDQGNDF